MDAADPASLRSAFAGVDLVVVASSTAQYVETVARAVIEARIDYLDVQVSSAKLETLQALQGEIEHAGLCFITDGGFHPGLPAVLVRYAAGRFDRLDKANVGSVIKIDWNAVDLSPATIQELTGELLDFRMESFRNGQWEKKWSGYQHFDFGPPFGQQPCAPMMLEEMRSLPDTIPSLRETGFFVGGFNWFADWVAMLLGMAALKVAPKQAAESAGRLMEWSSEPSAGRPMARSCSSEQAAAARPAGDFADQAVTCRRLRADRGAGRSLSAAILGWKQAGGPASGARPISSIRSACYAISKAWVWRYKSTSSLSKLNRDHKETTQ